MAFCKSCGAKFDWYQVAETGKWMPVDSEPSPDGNVRIDVVANKASVVEPGSHHVLYLSHFATCPKAGEHRRRR